MMLNVPDSRDRAARQSRSAAHARDVPVPGKVWPDNESHLAGADNVESGPEKRQRRMSGFGKQGESIADISCPLDVQLGRWRCGCNAHIASDSLKDFGVPDGRGAGKYRNKVSGAVAGDGSGSAA